MELQKRSDEALIDILQSTTIHGLNHVYSARSKVSRILWFSLFLMGIGCFLSNIYSLIEKYKSNSIVMNNFINHETFIWPDLTFCNPTAPYVLENNTAVLEHWTATIGKTKNIIDIITKEKHQLFETIKTYHNEQSEIIEHAVLMSSIDPVKMQVHDFRKQILFYGFSVHHTKIYLTKENYHYASNLVQEKSEELFSTQFVQNRQNIPCHTFQIGNSKSIDFDSVHSLKFLISLNFESYLKFDSSYVPRSIHLYINHKGSLPKIEAITIMPGFNTEVKINQIRFHNYESRDYCRDEVYSVELYDTLFQNTKMYEGDYDDCKKIISQSLYVEKCNCYSPFLPIYKKDDGFPRLCFNASLFSEAEIKSNMDCMFQVFSNYSRNSTFNEIEVEKCGKYKDMKCNDLTYVTIPKKEVSLELQSGRMNDRMKSAFKEAHKMLFARDSPEKDNLKAIRENVATLTVRRGSEYGSLAKEKLDYSYSNLLSDIGGLMGFCLGLSVIGLIEFFGILYFLLLKLCGYEVTQIERRRNNKHNEQTVELNS